MIEVGIGVVVWHDTGRQRERLQQFPAFGLRYVHQFVGTDKRPVVEHQPRERLRHGILEVARVLQSKGDPREGIWEVVMDFTKDIGGDITAMTRPEVTQ